MNRRIASGLLLAAALAPGCNPDSMESESDAASATAGPSAATSSTSSTGAPHPQAFAVNVYPIVWAGDRIYHVVREGFDTFVRAYDTEAKSNADIAKVSANFYALAVAPDESWYARGSGLEITLAPLP
ncbi:MAG: hypothetical protein H6711_15780 [Myxococcales bacterium]|nr:hypothetical protein [Myxococcales bacterium]